MNLNHRGIFVVASNSLAFVLLSLLFLGIGSETLAQGTNTTTSSNTTNATAASTGEVSPITVIMPAGSAGAVGGGDTNQIHN